VGSGVADASTTFRFLADQQGSTLANRKGHNLGGKQSVRFRATDHDKLPFVQEAEWMD
jgi:hypothetical protein